MICDESYMIHLRIKFTLYGMISITTLSVPESLAQTALRLGARYDHVKDIWYSFDPVPDLLKKFLGSGVQGAHLYPEQLPHCPVCGLDLHLLFDKWGNTHLYRCSDEMCSGRLEVNSFFSIFATERRHALVFEPDPHDAGIEALECLHCKVPMQRTFFGNQFFRVCKNSIECGHFIPESSLGLEYYRNIGLTQDAETQGGDLKNYIHDLSYVPSRDGSQGRQWRGLGLEDIKKDLVTHAQRISDLFSCIARPKTMCSDIDSHRKKVIALLGLYIHCFDISKTAEMFNQIVTFRHEQMRLWDMTGTLARISALEDRLIVECSFLGRPFR